jgi:nitroreductase
MALDELAEDAVRDNRTKWIAVYIGVLAVLLAICAMGGDNVDKDAQRFNIDASNTWAFFQAKNMRRASLRLAADELELMLAANPLMDTAARAALQAKVDEYRAQDKVLTSDPAKQEGLDELYVKAKALEAARDTALAQDPYFDWSNALLQIAIVLASVSIISGSTVLLVASGGLGLIGALLMLNGFLMLVAVPGVG